MKADLDVIVVKGPEVALRQIRWRQRSPVRGGCCRSVLSQGSGPIDAWIRERGASFLTDGYSPRVNIASRPRRPTQEAPDRFSLAALAVDSPELNSYS